MCGFIICIVNLCIFIACAFFVVIYCLCEVSVAYGPLSQINLLADEQLFSKTVRLSNGVLHALLTHHSVASRHYSLMAPRTLTKVP